MAATDNSLDFGLAMEVIAHFQLSEQEAKIIFQDVCDSVKNWQKEAASAEIDRAGQDRMAAAFRY
ncbi:hypothetical protein [Thiopseudomonas denitrificans]|uniref:hypothetical protein n=1 Tax=Thiopseudomonas denitrificans TaxID=1501432 RepID=UPI000C76F357|nr:hypothetical protein [Thiopseudomonas denitrificans]